MKIEKISIIVNGKRATVRVRANMLLVDLIRYQLGLTGTHVGCDTADCGACTVLLNGKSIKSCNVLAIQVANSKITTVEGLSKNGKLNYLQKSFLEHNAMQCGYCTTGMLMQAKYLLDNRLAFTDEEIKEGLSGNLCRCTGYTSIIETLRDIAAKKSSRRNASKPVR